MAKQVSRILSIAFFLTWSVVPALSQRTLSAKINRLQPRPVAVSGDSDRVRDGLSGPVRRVRTEVVKVANVSGNIVEGDKRVLLETAEYDIKGTKTQNQYFPIAGSTLTGRELYKYDDKGNISEMTLLAADGALISKEVYKYDYDSVGNWTKMTTSVAVVENGKINFEPTEFTYRTIFYYLDEKMARMLEPAQSASSNTPSPVDTAKRGEPGNESVKPANTSSVAEQPKAPNKSASKHGSTRTGAPVLPTAFALDKSKLLLSQPVPPDTLGSGAVINKPVVVLDSEPPPTSSPKPILKPVSKGVLNGAAINLPAPAYPDVARRMRTTGVVVVEVVIDENGKVISATAVSGPNILRDVAVQAGFRARFSPTTLSGQPVKVTGTINYNFTLGQ